MRRDSSWRDAVGIVVVAVVAAAVSNALAGPERKLHWIGNYASAPAAAPGAVSPTPSPGVAAAAVTPAAGDEAGKAFAPHPDKAWWRSPGMTSPPSTRAGTSSSRRAPLSVYRAGHIAGARSISIWEADADDKVKVLFAEGRDQSAPIVVYCSGGDCEDSHHARREALLRRLRQRARLQGRLPGPGEAGPRREEGRRAVNSRLTGPG